MRKQLRLSGSGGQGVITAAIIFAEAAVAEGMEAVQSQSYGPEARGGASKSEVIIDDQPIYHPHVETPDVVLAMTQKAADKYYTDLNSDGILILDTDLVPEPPKFPNIIKIPITKLAVEDIGKALFANIVALGALVKVTDIVSLDAIKKAVANRVPPHTVEQNMKALQVGWDAVSKSM
ncbi:MAG: 2-oxoacid:acceptor oxidoreductase family protein [Anaerovibrio sp.]|uniref:2-oxoacid:acceptor oxidoreductase family protein n=1 Tax=Anaerovibrio sp. TaxID=1872532 RepID=UPI0025FCF83D|nr:2-oxoacid:acceptor oxidoreductase family protein [Anaerovibrio sp.]MCR5175238.1 2-oxoacid:acceptor oxidoreductase family protein [Anaerovibrio sp.]